MAVEELCHKPRTFKKSNLPNEQFLSHFVTAPFTQRSLLFLKNNALPTVSSLHFGRDDRQFVVVRKFSN